MSRGGEIGPGSILLALLGVAAVAGGIWVLVDALDIKLPWESEPERRTTGTTGDIDAKNSSGRSGAYYLPENYRDRILPLMVAFHGTSASGRAMAASFGPLADEYGFAIVAPDSRVAPGGLVTWEVGERSYEVTPDYVHTKACLDEVVAIPGLNIDMDHILAVGYSGGGSSAPYVATREPVYTAFAVLHGGVFTGGLGSNVIPGWFSTGETDHMRPPDMVREAAASVEGLGFDDITFHTFAGGHGMTVEEKRGLIDWWLGD